MRRAFFGVAVLLVGVVTAAQPPALPLPDKDARFAVSSGTTDYKRLLLSKSVQKELELTNDQATAVTELGKENSKKYLEASKAIDKTLSPKDRIAKRAEIREKFEKEYHEGLA